MRGEILRGKERARVNEGEILRGKERAMVNEGEEIEKERESQG